MLADPCTPRIVQSCFLLADAMKGGPYDPAGYRARLAAERTRIDSLGDEQLDLAVPDVKRRVRYRGAKWSLSVVDLAVCSVWKHMGGRPWATGPVPKVADYLTASRIPDVKLLDIANVARLTFAELPLIVFRRKRSAGQYRIDDGCHRAVAYHLAGFRQAFAYVGEYHGSGELAWPWEG